MFTAGPSTRHGLRISIVNSTITVNVIKREHHLRQARPLECSSPMKETGIPSSPWRC